MNIGLYKNDERAVLERFKSCTRSKEYLQTSSDLMTQICFANGPMVVLDCMLGCVGIDRCSMVHVPECMHPVSSAPL